MATNTVRTVRIVIDSSGAQQGAAAVNAALGSIGQAAIGAGAGINGVQTQLQQAAAAAQAAAAQFGAANQNIGLVGGSAGRVTTGLRSAGTEAGLTAYHMQNLAFQMNDVVTSIASGNGVLRTFAQQGGQIYQVMQQSGLGVFSFGAALLNMLGILKITSSASQAARVQEKAGITSIIAARLEATKAAYVEAEAEILLAATERRLAQTQAQLAIATARATAAGQAQTASIAEQTTLTEALRIAQAQQAAAAANAARMSTVALTPFSLALGAAAVVAGVLAGALIGVRESVASDSEMKQFASTLGLTHQEMKRLKDVTVTWGDTWHGILDTIAENWGTTTANMSKAWSGFWVKVGHYSQEALAQFYGGVAYVGTAVVEIFKSLGNAIGHWIGVGVNLGIAAFEKFINWISGGLNKISNYMHDTFGVGSGKGFGTVSLGRVEVGALEDGSAAAIGAKAAAARNQAMGQVRSTFSRMAQHSDEEARKRLTKEAQDIKDGRADKKAPKAKEDPMAAAIENVKKYQDDLIAANTALAVMNSLQQKILAGDISANDEMAKTIKAETERKAQLENRDKWGKQWDKLSKDDQLRQNAIATSIADQRIQTEALSEALKRRVQEQQKLTALATQVSAAMNTDWRQSQAITENERIRLAGEKEMQALRDKGVSTTDAIAQSQIAAATAAERQAIAYERMLAAAARVNSLLDKMNPRLAVQRDYEQNVDAIGQYTRAKDEAAGYDPAAVAANHKMQDELIRYAKEQAIKALDDIANKARSEFYDNFSNAITDLAGLFKGKFGDALNKLAAIISEMGKPADAQGGLMGFFSKLLGNSFNADGSVAGRSSFGQGMDSAINTMWSPSALQKTFADPMHSLSDGFSTFKNLFDPTKGGGFMKGLGGAIAGALQGAQVGGAVNSLLAPLGQALGFKTSALGASIGGALGSAFGPIGSIIGSIGGSLIGGLFKKSPKATGSVGLDSLTGLFSAGSVTGNDDKAKQMAQDLANGIADQVNQIVQSLGGQLQGAYSEAIKVKKGKFYIDGKKFSDEAQAQFYAVQQALMKTLTNVSAFTKRVIAAANSSNFSGVISVASQYEQVLDELGQLKNSFSQTITDIVTSMEKLKASMSSLGATTEELAKVNEYEQLKLKSALDEQLSTLRDLQKFLSGEGSGKTDYQRLLDDMNKLQGLKADIAAGKTVDQSALNDLVREIDSLAGSVYGTAGPQFQDILTQLNDIVNGAIGNVQQSYNDAMLAAQQTQISLLQQIAINTGNGGSTSSGASSGGYTSSSGTSTLQSV
jgi:hypothetical protein